MVEWLAMLADRNSLATIHRIKGIKEETIMDWLREAANRMEEIEGLLLVNHLSLAVTKGKKRPSRRDRSRHILAMHCPRY